MAASKLKSIDDYHSLVDLLDQAFASHASRVAVASLGATKTYAELDQLSRQFAAWLQALSLPSASRVAIMLPNVIASPVSLMGTLRAGHVVVNVNPLYTPRELEAQLADSEPAVMVVFEAFAATLSKVNPALRPQHVVVVKPGDLLGVPKSWLVNLVVRHVQRKVPAWQLDGAVFFEDVLKRGEQARYESIVLKPDDLAFLQYTGGTTGEPRAAMLSHSNVVANILQVDIVAQPVLGDLVSNQVTMLTALPLYHVFAMTVCELYAFHAGMRVVLVINPRDLKALTVLWRKEAPHIFPAVNTLFAALLRHDAFRQLDFSNLRLALGGGMAIHGPVAEQWQTLTGRTIVEGYGMSETSPVICANPTDAKHFSATVGWPLPDTQVQILDDNQTPVPDGVSGEIAVHGPQVMQGYWRAPEQTAAQMTDQGYLLTGDIGCRQPDGQIRIIDRKKDMILVSGFNVYPAEIDAVFSQHPDVLECAAVGVEDDMTGQAVRLYVVPSRPGIDTDALRQWGRTQLTGYKCPRDVRLVESLPKNPVGKTLRRMLSKD